METTWASQIMEINIERLRQQTSGYVPWSRTNWDRVFYNNFYKNMILVSISLLFLVFTMFSFSLIYN
jgi:hypothetical protein